MSVPETDFLRVYLDPLVIAPPNSKYAGYPKNWYMQERVSADVEYPAIKDYIRERSGFRCQRCKHPYPPDITKTCPRGEWTPCDEDCRHVGPVQLLTTEGWSDHHPTTSEAWGAAVHAAGQGRAQWRILTTHHLNGIKHDCRWWNLAALCQRCHLTIQSKVYMERPYDREHTPWFKMHAAGFYAAHILGEELSRKETAERLEELLALQHRQGSIVPIDWQTL